MTSTAPVFPWFHDLTVSGDSTLVMSPPSTRARVPAALRGAPRHGVNPRIVVGLDHLRSAQGIKIDTFGAGSALVLSNTFDPAIGRRSSTFGWWFVHLGGEHAGRARYLRPFDCSGPSHHLRCWRSPRPLLDQGELMKKLLIILILAAIGIAVVKKVREA